MTSHVMNESAKGKEEKRSKGERNARSKESARGIPLIVAKKSGAGRGILFSSAKLQNLGFWGIVTQ